MRITRFLMMILLIFSPKCLAIEMPRGAFWIANHWPDIRSEEQPVQWRSTADASISGSAAPTLENMQWIQKKLGSKYKIYIVDLRQETHVYIDGLPISIFYKQDQINWGKSDREIKADETAWTKKLGSGREIIVNKLGIPKTISVKTAMTEAQVVESMGLGYLRMYVPDYHPPTPVQVDQFLGWIKSLPENSWVHFHCAAGKGRTTTFMLMRDIMENAKRVSLEDLAIRQVKLGGADLLGVSKNIALQPWKAEFHNARVAYLHHFYNYIKSGAYPRETFSDWMAKQPADAYHAILKTAAYYQT